MAFSSALYYPNIQVHDEGWLKTAILYWDETKTIVPASMSEPYSNTTCVEAFHEGVLSPYHVNPEMESVRDLAGQVIDYLDSREAEGVFLEGQAGGGRIHAERLPDIGAFVRLHPEKLGYEIERRLRQFRSGEWLHVDDGFARFYMTLLATKLSEQASLGLLTNLPSSASLASDVRIDSRLHPFGFMSHLDPEALEFMRFRAPDPYWRRYHWHRYGERRMPSTLARAMPCWPN
jgi:hypothetical protein